MEIKEAYDKAISDLDRIAHTTSTAILATQSKKAIEAHVVAQAKRIEGQDERHEGVVCQLVMQIRELEAFKAKVLGSPKMWIAYEDTEAGRLIEDGHRHKSEVDGWRSPICGVQEVYAVPVESVAEKEEKPFDWLAEKLKLKTTPGGPTIAEAAAKYEEEAK